MVVGIFSHWSLVFWVLKANSWHAQGNCPTLSQIKRHYISWCLIYTPPKTNIEPENHPVEKETHLPYLHFLGSMLVFRGVHNTCINEQFHFGMAHMIFAPLFEWEGAVIWSVIQFLEIWVFIRQAPPARPAKPPYLPFGIVTDWVVFPNS